VQKKQPTPVKGATQAKGNPNQTKR